ncbi:uncharacterized protein PG986_013144 [Apiospora aurea]|uniref:DUF7582 domain-containing protein n=1 Tax=Apiospora aurea TaxID=335848 RepID=A0ABR1PUR4_9PEZI
MGCGGSKQARTSPGAGPRPTPRPQQQPGARLNIGSPQQVMIHVPRNRVDQHGELLQQVSHDIGRDELAAALAYVAQYIRQRRSRITVVAVGGAVNTLYLRSRGSTQDIDIFGADFNNDARVLLDRAMHAAQQRFPALGTDWLNTETQMWMPGPLHSELTRVAKVQNVKIFERPGLTIYAAPWHYAFTAKISRILTGGDQARSYDMDDALTYIHEYIRAHGNRPVPINTALQWARQFHHEVTANVLRDRVNRLYRSRYGTAAFV